MRTESVFVRLLGFPVLLLAVLAAFAGTNDKEPAPRFHAKTMGGQNFTNESVKGKVVLFEFWTTWCPYCKGEEGFVDQIATEFKDKGLIVLAVNVGESKKAVKKYLEQHPRTTPIVLMEDTNLAAMYEATAYPIYVLIDRDGFVVETQRGAAGEARLRRILARVGISRDSAVENYSGPPRPSESAPSPRAI